jgi:peroxiredoxin
MVSTMVLLGCAFAPGQAVNSPGGPDWVVRPQLTPGQEFVYRGTFKEEAQGAVQYGRSNRLELRALVLDGPRTPTPVVLLTVHRAYDGRTDGRANNAVPASVRLERCFVDQHGQLTSDPGVNIAVPIAGPPSLEVGMFPALPGERLAANQAWLAAEPGRPPRTWRVMGADTVNGTRCIRIVGEQQSEEWDRPRHDRPGWRRQDTIWLAPRVGLAYRVERVIEKREPGSDEPAQRSVLRYDLESSVANSGQFFDDCGQEVTQALAFAAAAGPLLPAPKGNGPQLNALANKIAFYLEHEPPTPYREAVLQVRRLVEAGRRGEAPMTIPAEPAGDPGVIARGETAPDFVAPEVGSRSSTNLRRWLGKPVLLVFFSPTSTTADPLLRFVQRLAVAHAQDLTVLGMAMSDDADLVRSRTGPLHLSFPLLNGTGLRRSYDILATPKMVLLDSAGAVRGTFVGWGNEVPLEVVEELRRWLPQK